MNALGLDRRSCACALRSYWRAIRRVAALARDDDPSARARAALDRLMFELEVDVGARHSESGRSRMTPVEAAVLHPALAGAWRSLDAIAPRDPPASWQTALGAALAVLRDALRTLRRGRGSAALAFTAEPNA